MKWNLVNDERSEGLMNALCALSLSPILSFSRINNNNDQVAHGLVQPSAQEICFGSDYLYLWFLVCLFILWYWLHLVAPVYIFFFSIRRMYVIECVLLGRGMAGGIDRRSHRLQMGRLAKV